MSHSIEQFLDEKWLKDNPEHIYNIWEKEGEKGQFLSRYEGYLRSVIPILQSTKNLRAKMRNSEQFVDTYYELEVGSFFMKKGLEVNFEKCLEGKTPDIFVEKENIVVEVKNLREMDKTKRNLETHEVFFDEKSKLKDKVFEELEKYSEKRIIYALIVILCRDIFDPPSISVDDCEAAFGCHESRMYATVDNQVMSKKTVNVGLPYDIYGWQTASLSGVGLWSPEREEILFYRNVNASFQVPIEFLDSLVEYKPRLSTKWRPLW